MKISLYTLLSITTLRAAASAFAVVTGDEYRNPDFVPTQDVADKVAALIDHRYANLTPVGQETPLLYIQTMEAFLSEIRVIDDQAWAAKQTFRVLGLAMPAAWSNLP